MSNVTDKTSLRNVYAYHLAQEIFTKSGWSPKTQFITLVVNGKYMGLYGFMEKADIDENRVNLPDDGSFLAEVNPRLNRAWNFTSAKGVDFSIREKAGGDEAYYKHAETVLRTFERILYSEQFTDEATGYRAYIDIGSFVDWYLTNEYTKNHDARFQASCFMHWNEGEQRLYMGPVWDFDISCGNYNKRDCDKPEGLWIQSELWFARLWEDPWFRKQVALRWHETREAVLNSVGWIEQQAKAITNAANLDDKVWLRFGHRQWPNAPGYRERKTYQAEVAYMTSFCRKRIDWLDGEFARERAETAQD